MQTMHVRPPLVYGRDAPGNFALLRKAVGGDMLARGLIDYFAQNESLLLALCANARIAPESFMRVWHRLNRSE